jgi:primosomal protein N' (replication factor Y) (superfamily II helicase)
VENDPLIAGRLHPASVPGHRGSALVSPGMPETSEKTIARVEPLTLARAVRGPFDYRVPSAQPGVKVGTLLRVPFGRRSVLGVVVGLAERSELEPDRLAEPEEVLEGGTPGDLVELAHWMAAEYCSTPGRALGLMLAPGAARGARAKQALVAEITPAGRQALEAGDRLTSGQRIVLESLRDGPLRAAEVGTPTLRRLERRGLVGMSLQSQARRPTAPPVGQASARAPALTPDQLAALDEIRAAVVRAARHELPAAGGRYLLHGITGSGKTEVYLGAVEAALDAGRDAIVLVPEIGLTPQTVARFEARLGPLVAVLHSGLGEGERFDEWQRLRSGEARVCVGPRSAVFAPLPDVGLIVVDEEHDPSYKHEGDPRYDARTVAQRRAEDRGAVLVCGSATPRPESVVSLRRLRLPARIDGRSLPPVEVLDMRGQHHPLHPRTRNALAELRANQGKAIILLNRRGWANFLSCRACGRVWSCPNCEVTLVVHRLEATIACHHCGHREAVPSRCPQCASAALSRHGAGTERLEHELRAALGDDGFPVFRLDADSAQGKDRAAVTLSRFSMAGAGLLIGTQMVAKGHDFPDVTLGVVLDADQTLRFPDFRAEERTFSLITQLAGRAGRGDGGGIVLVQTLAPGARAIVHASRHDSDAFLTEELARRRALSYPPFASLIRVVCSASEAAAAADLAASLHRRIAGAGPDRPAERTLLGPAPLFRLRGRARSQLLLKAADRDAAIAAVGTAVDEMASVASRNKVSISVDVDPQ